MRVPPMIRWTALAILGLLIAAGVSVAASSLASQQIGLASEPLNAGDALAPPPRTQATSHARRPATHHAGVSNQRTTPPVSNQRTTPPITPAPPAAAVPTQPMVSPPTSPRSPSIPRGQTGGDGGGDHSEGDRNAKSGSHGADD
jgi:hypothetical protein